MLSLETRQNIEVIEVEAERLIKESSQEGRFPIRLSKILDKLGLTVKIFDSQSNPEFIDISGMIDKIKKVIYINGEEPLSRQRFTIAHELGHFILKHEKDIDYRSITYNQEPEEIQANLFAASLLMPRDIFISVYEKMNINELAMFFGVSRRAVGMRADGIFNNGF